MQVSGLHTGGSVPHADMRWGLKSPGSAGSLLDIVNLLAGEHADEAVWDADTAVKMGEIVRSSAGTAGV